MNPFHHLEDKKLMNLYKDGEQMAFEVLYMRHKDKIYSYLYKRVQADAVEDLFQGTFIKLHKSRSLYDDKYEVLPWLYTICKSVLLDYFKKEKKQPLFVEEVEVAIADSNADEEINLDQYNLRPKEKEAIKMRFVDDLEYEEMAQLIGTSESNSRKIISRALLKIKKALTGDENE